MRKERLVRLLKFAMLYFQNKASFRLTLLKKYFSGNASFRNIIVHLPALNYVVFSGNDHFLYRDRTI